MKSRFAAGLGSIVVAMLSAPGFAQDRADDVILDKEKLPAVSEDKQVYLEEIVVTARRSEQSLQSAPLAIDAVTEQTINERGIHSAADVADLSAALIFDEGLVPTDTRPVIRSLSSSRGRANVATLVDNVDVSGESMTTGGGGLTANMRLLDLERVEVVKGPQSVLYGRSAFSGAIYYVSKRPASEFGGDLVTRFSENGSLENRLSLSGPLMGEDLRARLNLANWETDGEYRNPVTGGKLGNGDGLGGALAVEWDFADSWEAYARVEHSKDHYGQRAVVMRRALLNSPPGNMDSIGFWHGIVAPEAENLPWQFDQANLAACADPANRAYPYFDDTDHGFCRPTLTGELRATANEVDLSYDERDGGVFDGTDVTTTRWHFQLDWASPIGDVVWLSALTQNKSRTQEDFDLTNFRLGDPVNPLVLQYGFSALSDISHAVSQFSQEIRIQHVDDGLSWFVSALYWQESHDTDWNDLFWMREGGFDAFLFLGMQTATEPAVDTPTTLLRRDVKHYSIAASVTWPFLDDWSVTAEGRYLSEKSDYFGTGEDRGAYSAIGACDWMGNPKSSCPPGSNQMQDSAFVPRISVDWQINDALFSYLTYAEGFKPGGIDTLSANADVTDGEYAPEKLQTLEWGMKSSWFERRLQANGAVFLYRYTDQQQNVQLLVENSLTTWVVNAGETDVNGFEFDLNFLLTPGLTGGLGYVFTDAKYADFNLQRINDQAGAGSSLSSNGLADAGNAEGDYSGRQVQLTPRHSATANLRFERDVFGGDMFVDLAGRYIAKRYLSHGNTSWLPAHSLWDLNLGFNREAWGVQIFVDNLLDEDAIRTGIRNPDYGFDATAQGGISNAAMLILPQRRTLGMSLSIHF